MSYTDISRQVYMRVTIQFPTPLVATKDDYLVDVYWTEETGSPSHYPYGSVTADRASITLYSPKGLFDPNNRASKYFGSIKRGLEISIEIKTHSTDWLNLGTFYVQDWSYSSASGTASIDVVDKIQDKLKDSEPIPNILLDVGLKDACESLGIIAEDLVTFKSFSTDKSWSETVDLICEATRCFCTTDRQDNIVMRKPVLSAPYNIDDDTLLISIKNKSNLPTPSGDIVIEYGVPQVERNVPVLQLTNEEIIEGTNELGTFQTSVKHVLHYSVGNVSNVPSAKISYSGTANNVNLVVESFSEGLADITIRADVINYVMKQLGNTADNSSAIYSNYLVQDEISARYLRDMYRAFVNLEAPVLEIVTRGDPTLLVGDTVKLSSTKYNTDFEGIVIRHEYKYTGSLTCTTTLLHKEVVL